MLATIVRPAYTFDRPFGGGRSPSGDVCGTPRDDSLRVTDTGGAGTQIWTGAGRDVVNSQNRKNDEIWGGAGDTATIDWCRPDGKIRDVVHQVAKVKTVKVTCTGVKQSSGYRSQAPLTHPYDEPDVLCTVGKSGARLVTIAHEPEIRAADATANVDWQTVAFSAILFKGSGDDATIEDQSPWVWDRAPDEQLLDFAGNFWRRFRETGHRQIFFHPAGSGPYRVAIRYHWYAANGSADYDTLDWAKYHFGHFGSASQGYCNFPGPPPPDGHYAGTTDESKNVSFDSAPIWSTVPRDVGGSRLTNVKVSSSISCTPAKTLTYSITVDAGRWIQLNADNTFAYARIGNVNDPSRQNVSASYFLAGKIDTAGSAAGSYYIQQIAFDESGTHYNCTGAPHGWTAAKSG